MKKVSRILILLLVLLCFTGLAQASDNAPTPGRVMLTFDDGPSGKITRALLQLLQEEDVPATFFLCGYRIAQYPELVAEIAAQGHAIGAHSYSHSYLHKLSPEQIRQEITASIDAITEITGERVILFRPPGGLYSKDVTDELERAGLTLALWSIDPEDWRGKDAEQIAASVLRQAHGDCVILLHDLNMQTVQATRTIIRSLKAQGYLFTTMP